MASSSRTRKKTSRKKSGNKKTARKTTKKAAAKGKAADCTPKGETEQQSATAVEEPPAQPPPDDGPSPMEVLFGETAQGAQGAEEPQQFQEPDEGPMPSMHELHELVEQLGRTVQQQWRELQEATRSLDELRSHSPRRSDVMEGRTYLSQDMRALVEPLQQETQRLRRRVQWSFGILAGLAVVGVPALVKVLFA